MLADFVDVTTADGIPPDVPDDILEVKQAYRKETVFCRSGSRSFLMVLA